MTAFEDALISFGLTATEARIYLAGLADVSVTLQDLAKRTKIKRPTLYHALHTLIEKGLVAEKKEINKSFFTMADPHMIRGLLERQKEVADERMQTLNLLMPALLHKKKAGKGDDVTVIQYHGIEGMKTVVDIACYCKSKRWDIIAPFRNFLREYDKEYAQRYLRAKKNHGILSRTLWEWTPQSRTLTKEEVEHRNPRTMPSAMQGKFQSMIILFDDKVALFAPYEKLSAILITSKEIHAMFKAMFEAIWEVSEEHQ